MKFKPVIEEDANGNYCLMIFALANDGTGWSKYSEKPCYSMTEFRVKVAAFKKLLKRKT